VFVILAIEVEGARKAIAQGNFWLPAKFRADFGVVANIIANINPFSLCGELNQAVATTD
jgi:hypothetical protein